MNDLIHDTTEEAQSSTRTIGTALIVVGFFLLACLIAAAVIIIEIGAAEFFRILLGG